jgi:hypothetical protein
MATRGGVKAGKAFVVITAVDRTKRVLNKVAQRFAQFGSRLTSLGRNMIAGSIAALTPVGFALNTYMQFDDMMRQVGARSHETGENLKALREQAKRLWWCHQVCRAGSSFASGCAGNLWFQKC